MSEAGSTSPTRSGHRHTPPVSLIIQELFDRSRPPSVAGDAGTGADPPSWRCETSRTILRTGAGFDGRGLARMHRRDGVMRRVVARECPCGAGRSDLSRVRSALSGRASRGCNYLMLFPVRSAVFDEPNLVSHAGLVPAMAPGRPGRPDRAGGSPVDGARRRRAMRPGAKVSALVAGMVAGADSIADMAVLRHGGMGRLFTGVRAPSTLGTFLRAFRFGHVRQLDAVAARFLTGLTRHAPLISTAGGGHLRRYRRHDPVHLRVRQAGHRLRVLRGQGIERAAGDRVDGGRRRR